MAIVTVHRLFGDDKFPVKAVPHPNPKAVKMVCISVPQLKLVCHDFWNIHLRMGNDGVEYGVFHRDNVNFL